MKKLIFLTTVFLGTLSCKLPTSSKNLPDPVMFEGPSMPSNAGFFTIYRNTYGTILDRHLSESDAFWADVSECMSIDINRLRGFSILLEDSISFACGEKTAAGCYYYDSSSVETRSHISVLGGPELIFPNDQNYPVGFREIEYKRIWRHEMVHLGFAMRGEDYGHENGSPLWACQCPPEYTDCFTWDQNTQMRMQEAIRAFE